MNTIYKNYIDLYGNFSHILNIKIDKSLSEDEKRIILFDIYDLINEKEIKKNISNTIISIKWRVYDESDLLNYFTDIFEYKAFGEISQQITFLSLFLKEDISCIQNFFKITGRYELNTHFDYSKYDNRENIFIISLCYFQSRASHVGAIYMCTQKDLKLYCPCIYVFSCRQKP